MKKYKLPVKVTITEEQVDNILDSAINWCGYWCDEINYEKKPKGTKYMSEALTHGGTLVFSIDEPYEEGGACSFLLTRIGFLKGIADYGEFDFDNFDGPMSDAVLQQALFGEVVYG